MVLNFSRMLATLRRVLTTAVRLDGRILFVDSRFDEPVANPPYEVVTNPMVR